MLVLDLSQWTNGGHLEQIRLTVQISFHVETYNKTLLVRSKNRYSNCLLINRIADYY